MRTLLKTIVTLAVLLAIAVGGYFMYRRGQAKEMGEEYPFSRAPQDLLREVTGLFDGDDPGEPPAKAARPGESFPATGTAKEEGSGRSATASAPAATPDRFPEARARYQAGKYEEALPLLYAALSAPGASGERPRELAARSRLFLLLLEDAPAGEALAGPPVARIRTAGGEAMLVRVKDETADEIEFRGEGGVGARVPKKNLKEVRVARTEKERKALYEDEYRRRHDEARTVEDLLELARLCRRAGLDDHLTYLLERALEMPGDSLQALVAKKHGEAERAGSPERRELTADLLTHFWSRGEYTRRALADRTGRTPRPAIGAEPGGAGGGGEDGPPSGIGGTTVRTPRTSDPDVDALLDKADRLKREADEHYMKAKPGDPDRAEHRRKAIAGYREAQAIYEEVEEKWGVGLERTFREIQLRLYQMLKDEPVR